MKIRFYTVTAMIRAARASVFYKETPGTFIECDDASEGFRSRYSGTEEGTNSRFYGRPAIRLGNCMMSNLDV